MQPRSIVAHHLSVALSLCALGSAGTSQCPLTWVNANSLPGVEEAHDAVSWDPDGPGPLPLQIVVAGPPGLAGSVYARGIAAFDLTASTWTPLGALNPYETLAHRLASGPNGELFMATTTTVRQWVGTSWTTVGQGILFPQYTTDIRCMAILPNGDLVIAGGFPSINGVAAANIARWNGSTWAPLGAGTNDVIENLIVLQNGDLCALGYFTVAGNTSIRGLAIWNGSNWSALGSGLQGAATAGAQLSGGEIVVYSVTGPGWSLQLWNGSGWSTLVPNAPPIASLTALANGELAVGGSFGAIAGVAANYVARWNGTVWQPLGAGIQFEVFGAVTRLRSLPNGRILAAGSFSTADGHAARSVARWNGTAWQPLGTGLNRPVHALRRMRNGHVVAMGEFTGVDTPSGVPTNRIARWDGSTWQGFGVGLDSIVKDVAELPNGDLVAVGLFQHSGALTLNRVAQWNGAAWQAMGQGTENNVSAVGVLPNGDVVIAGHFYTANGVTTNRVARWDGTTWQPLGIGLDGGALALVILSNGDIVVGGHFHAAGGVAAEGVARWDGSNWHAMGAGLSNTKELQVRADGTVIASNGTNVVAWNGTSWSSLGPAAGVRADAVVELPNGDLLTGAPPTYTLPSFTTTSLWRWSAGGVTPLLGAASSFVRDLLWMPNGEVWVAGDFTRVGIATLSGIGSPSPYLARFTTACPATSSTYGSGCAGPAGPVWLVADASPWVGSTWRTTASGMPQNALAVGVFGTGMTNQLLPLAVQPGCRLWVQASVLTILPITAGQAHSTFAIPNSVTLVGLTFAEQVVAIALDPTGNILGTASSNATVATIGMF